jgi:hypothetical protein
MEVNFMEVPIMSFKKLIGMAAVVTLIILLSACNLGSTPAPTQDVGMIYTQAAQLVATQFAMQQTQTAMAVPPTAPPSPTVQAFPTSPLVTPFGAGTPFGASTPFGVGTQPGGFLPTATIMVLATSAAPKCNDAMFTGEENYPDGSVLKSGQEFQKYWAIQNTGTCTWDEGYEFHYNGGTLDGYSIKIKKAVDFVEPGEVITFQVNLTASLEPNTYTDTWSMMDDKGFIFGPSPIATVSIVVKKK